jgi:hypothetical protein
MSHGPADDSESKSQKSRRRIWDPDSKKEARRDRRKGEGTIVIKKIDKSAEDIRGMLKGFRFEQETEVR